MRYRSERKSSDGRLNIQNRNEGSAETNQHSDQIRNHAVGGPNPRAAVSLTASRSGTPAMRSASAAMTLRNDQSFLPPRDRRVQSTTIFDDPFMLQGMIEKAVRAALAIKDQETEYLKDCHAEELLTQKIYLDDKLKRSTMQNNMVVAQLQASLECLQQTSANEKAMLTAEYDEAAANLAAEAREQIDSLKTENGEVERKIHSLKCRIDELEDLLSAANDRELEEADRFENSESQNRLLNLRLSELSGFHGAMGDRIHSLVEEKSNLLKRVQIAENRNKELSQDLDSVIEMGEGLLDAFEFKERAYERIIKKLSPEESPKVQVATHAIKEVRHSSYPLAFRVCRIDS